MPPRDVAVRAAAPVTPIGVGAGDFAAALAEQRSGIDEIVAFDAAGLSVQVAGEVQEFDLAGYLDSVKSYVDRASAFGLAASALALRAAGWQPSDDEPIGVVLGTEYGCLDSMDLFAEKITTANPKFAQPFLFTQGYANAPNSLIAIEFGLRGFNACISCGRTSGAAAVLYAFDQVRHGRAGRLLAGGVDVLSQVLCTSLDGKTFGPLGEAAGILALEPAADAGDGVRMLGGGQCSGGQCGERAFRAALLDAELDADALDAIITVGDPAALGLLSLERPLVPNAQPELVTWLDASMGDTLGAAGAVAACAAVLLLERGIVHGARRVAVVSADLNEACVVLVFGRGE